MVDPFVLFAGLAVFLGFLTGYDPGSMTFSNFFPSNPSLKAKNRHPRLRRRDIIPLLPSFATKNSTAANEIMLELNIILRRSRGGVNALNRNKPSMIPVINAEINVRGNA